MLELLVSDRFFKMLCPKLEWLCGAGDQENFDSKQTASIASPGFENNSMACAWVQHPAGWRYQLLRREEPGLNLEPGLHQR
jgi:hypothetical protein